MNFVIVSVGILVIIAILYGLYSILNRVQDDDDD